MNDKPKILIVHDSTRKTHEIENILSGLDVSFFHAFSVKEAIGLTLREKFALVLMDINIADHKGFETAIKIKHRKGCEFLNIIVITAISTETEYLVNSAESGAVDIITKPLNPRLLRGKVVFLLNLYQNRRKLLSEIEKKIRRGDELQKARDSAENAALAKQQFLSNMSHEIRTSLNAIINSYQLLRDENPRVDQVENLEILRFSTESLLHLVNGILEYSKIEVGKIEFENIGFNLRELIKEVYQCFEQEALKKKIGLEAIFDEKMPELLMGDPFRIKQILMNLVGNAIKFTEKGKVTLKVETSDILIDEVEISFRVSDTGIGIPEERLDQIFESFSQANPSIFKQYGGTGLGLAIAQMLVKLQGGHLELISRVNSGSTFSFSLKFLVGKESQLPVLESGIDESKPMKGLSVLIAEDNFENQRIISKILSKWNITFDIAENGTVAVKKVQGKKFDLVLMDLHMPKMNGYDATISIRNMKGRYFKQLPIIAMTATAFMEDQKKIISEGMNGYIIKPFTPPELYSKIADFTRIRKKLTPNPDNRIN
jgi:signal transduction histidine kinase